MQIRATTYLAHLLELARESRSDDSRFVTVVGPVTAKAASMYNRAGEPHVSDASSRAEKPVSRVAGDAPRSYRALSARGVVEHQPQECVLAGIVSRSFLCTPVSSARRSCV